MRFSISNIGWDEKDDKPVFDMMKQYNFTGLEIAPTRIIPESPYDNAEQAQAWAQKLSDTYGFEIPSMQSIWYGRTERIFGSKEEREFLIEYTKMAIRFAEKIGCGNLVFGCPKNRTIIENADYDAGMEFFGTIAEYAVEYNTIIALEPNPPIYNTNFINTTQEAIDFIEKIGSKGLLLNLDTGTMIENNENIEVLQKKTELIHHVHISEPGLKPIEERKLHKRLSTMLKESSYQGFVSIEVGKQESVSIIGDMMEYVSSVFSE